MADAKKTLRITQVKSSVGRKADQGQTLRALGRLEILQFHGCDSFSVANGPAARAGSSPPANFRYAFRPWRKRDHAAEAAMIHNRV